MHVCGSTGFPKNFVLKICVYGSRELFWPNQTYNKFTLRALEMHLKKKLKFMAQEVFKKFYLKIPHLLL